MLDLRVCWDNGLLRFYDPKTQSYLPSHEEDRAGRRDAEVRDEERVRAEAAEIRADQEGEARLEAEHRRLRGQ